MGIASFIFGDEKKRTQLGSIVIDATPTITTSRSANITRSPVEAGANITDHARVNPLNLTLECYVSEAPTDDMQSFIQSVAGGLLSSGGYAIGAASKLGGASLIGTGLGALAAGKATSTLAGSYFPKRDENIGKTTLQQLLNLQESFIPFTVKTFFFNGENDDSIYKNMLIDNISAPQTAKDGKGLTFTVSMSSVRIVTLQTRDVSGQFKRGAQAANSGEKKTNRGTQGTKAADGKTANKSILSSWSGIGEKPLP